MEHLKTLGIFLMVASLSSYTIKNLKAFTFNSICNILVHLVFCYTKPVEQMYTPNLSFSLEYSKSHIEEHDYKPENGLISSCYFEKVTPFKIVKPTQPKGTYTREYCPWKKPCGISLVKHV